MASPSRPGTTQAKKSGGGWGSVFSNAVAGLESRLDTILADDSEASAKARAVAEEDSKKRTLSPPAAASRDPSRSRVNDRLAERLARATAAKSSSRTRSPSTSLPATSGRTTPAVAEQQAPTTVPVDETENKESQGSTDVTVTVSEEDVLNKEIGREEGGSDTAAATPPTSTVPRVSAESSSRPSLDVSRSEVSSRPSFDVPNGASHKTAAELEIELNDQREEMHIYLEKIDALQSKLTYLAQQSVAAAKEANASSDGKASEQALLSEKDEKIALLMQEGEKLSKTELRHLQTIKKLRAKAAEDEKATTETRKRLDRAEQAERELKTQLRKVEVAERQASNKAKQISVIEKQVDELKVDRENASELVRSLTVQLKESKDKLERTEKEAKEKSGEVDKGRIAALENDLEDAQIERKLAETRAEAELKKIHEDADGQKQLFAVRELELKNEISILESRVEAMRSRAEEASADGNVSGESTVKLLRQVETLQSQYALAKENWETIEGSLNARLVALETERDESNRRETEARKRARDAAVKARKAEEDVENANERERNLEREAQTLREESTAAQERFEQNQSAMVEAKAEFDRQRRDWESELAQKIEQERLKLQRDTSGNSLQQQSVPQPQPPTQQGPTRVESSIQLSRKTSYNPEFRRTRSRMASQDLTILHPDGRPVSRRGFPTSAAASPGLSTPNAPFMSREPSYISFERSNSVPLSPAAVEVGNPVTPDDAFELTDTPVDTPHSPDRTLADLVSTSTAPAAGPSVQLVERMSALVRRLESEKAATKDELHRLTDQRDSARDEIVTLMREVEAKRDAQSQAERLENERKVLQERYDASLEMLGEREEEVEELRADVKELKRLYRELVEQKLGDGRGRK